METKSYALKAVPQTDRVIRFIISDETPDREGDILIASGCDFANFQKNPQFLGFHDYRDFPMGIPKSWGIDTRTKQVWMNVYFPTLEELATDPENASEKAKQVDTVYNMYKLGMLNAVSVGFRTKQSEPIENSWGKKVTKWELLEVSAVPIPCNPNAIAEARGIKSFDQTLVNEMEKAMETKANRRLSKESATTLKGIHERMCKAHAEMDACHKELAGFFADEPEEEEPEIEQKPKAFDWDKVNDIVKGDK